MSRGGELSQDPKTAPTGRSAAEANSQTELCATLLTILVAIV